MKKTRRLWIFEINKRVRNYKENVFCISVKRQPHKMVKHTQKFVSFRWQIVWVCLTILWGWRLGLTMILVLFFLLLLSFYLKFRHFWKRLLSIISEKKICYFRQIQKSMKKTDLIKSLTYRPLKVHKVFTPESWNYNTNKRSL